MTDDLKTAFWTRLPDVQAGMLSADGARPVPMAPYADRDSNAIWFITAADTDIEKAAQTSGKGTFSVADPKANIYAMIEGQLTQVHDPAKLDELWNAFAAAWFKEGRRDDNIRLIRFTPAEAEVWATEGSAAFLYEVATANLTKATPQGDQHDMVNFVK